MSDQQATQRSNSPLHPALEGWIERKAAERIAELPSIPAEKVEQVIEAIYEGERRHVNAALEQIGPRAPAGDMVAEAVQTTKALRELDRIDEGKQIGWRDSPELRELLAADGPQMVNEISGPAESQSGRQEAYGPGWREQFQDPDPTAVPIRHDKPEMYAVYLNGELIDAYTQAGPALRGMMDVDRNYADDEIVLKADGETLATRERITVENKSTFIYAAPTKNQEVARMYLAMEYDLRSEGYRGDSQDQLLGDVMEDAQRVRAGQMTMADLTEQLRHRNMPTIDGRLSGPQEQSSSALVLGML